MPKETISNVPGNALVLKWGREQDTGQIGVDFGDNWFSFHSELDQDEVPEYNSLWFSFESRDDYNRAIRTLRKMRDAQFGKDA
jgi:hypothetical protein